MFRNNSPFMNVKQQYEKLRQEASDKDRVIESKSKEIVALTLQIEEIISNKSKIMNSQEIEQIRRNFLLELSELLYKIRFELARAKSSLVGEGQYPRVDHPTNNYHLMQMTEEVFLNDLHNKLNDLDEIISLSAEVAHISQEGDRCNPH